MSAKNLSLIPDQKNSLCISYKAIFHPAQNLGAIILLLRKVFNKQATTSKNSLHDTVLVKSKSVCYQKLHISILPQLITLWEHAFYVSNWLQCFSKCIAVNQYLWEFTNTQCEDKMSVCTMLLWAKHTSSKMHHTSLACNPLSFGFAQNAAEGKLHARGGAKLRFTSRRILS